MFGVYKLAIGAGVIMAIMITFYVLTTKLEIASTKLDTAKAAIQNKELVISALESSTEELNTTITRLTAKYKQYEASSVAAKKALAVWRAKSTATKFDTVVKKINPTGVDLATASCEAGVELNKSIAGLVYDEL